jgi:signal transduction histidine kinase
MFQEQPGRPSWTQHSQPDGPPPWQRPPAPQDHAPDWVRHRRRWRERGDRGPLRRRKDDRLAGGVASGVAAWRGFNPITVRIVFVVASIITVGWAVPAYFIAWLLMPAKGEQASIWSRAKHDSRGMALAFGLASALLVFLVVAGVLNNGVIERYGSAQVISLPALALIWRNAPEDEQADLRRLVAPLGMTGEATRRVTRLRIIGSIVLLGVGLADLASVQGGISLLRPLGGVLFVLIGLVLLLGPWWLRIARDLMFERQARARAEERADIAAHMHDSVLQTLALIQRRAGDPQAVVQLARAQERELRTWLFEGRAPGDADAASLAEGVRQIQRDVEALHGVPVEVVTVGDCPLDEHLSALLMAAREATVNAAKWSGAAVISVFAEVEADKVSIAVRDRGRGFEPAAVPGDRKGVAESIRGRMGRHGGEAAVQSAPGEGTKVTLSMPRQKPEQAGRPQAGQGSAQSAANGPRR